jgi:hypothetical protein
LLNATQAAFVCIALVVCASADVENDMANERGEIEYRLSFKTKDVEPAGKDFTDAETAQRKQFTSTGKFNVEIIGVDGTTGEHEMIDHPSMVKSDDGSWKTEPGMVQVARMKAANVGEIKEVKITGDNEDKWEPSWIKVNSNDFHSGEGNGIYYSRITKPVSKNQPVSAKSDVDPEDDHHLHKCFAQFCQKSEKRMLAEGDDEPPTHEHGGHFGPLGEGMPGTERDHTMTRGHFMREFYAMEQIDDDDEDFMRTHSVMSV